MTLEDLFKNLTIDEMLQCVSTTAEQEYTARVNYHNPFRTSRSPLPLNSRTFVWTDMSYLERLVSNLNKVVDKKLEANFAAFERELEHASQVQEGGDDAHP